MRAEGFTFIEILLATALMAAVVLLATQVLAVSGHRSGQITANAVPDGEAALAILARDLRCASMSATDPESVFVVHAQDGFSRLTFFRTVSPNGEPVFRRTTYIVQRSPGGKFALWREDDDSHEPLCEDVTEFDLKVYGGDGWTREWGWDAAERKPVSGIRGLPLMVSVKIVAGGRVSSQTLPVMTSLLERSLHG